MTGPFPRHRQLGPTKIHLLLLLLVTCSVSFVDAECDSCTLTVMCWIGGGQREEGCSGPSWLVTCCVPQVTRSDDDDDDDGSNDARAVASPSALTLQQFPLLQPPRASNIVGGLRSASGSNPFPQQLAPLANTLVEEIANFGRNEWMTALPSQHRLFVKPVKPPPPPPSPSAGPLALPYTNQLSGPIQPIMTQQQIYQKSREHVHHQMPSSHPQQPFIALNSIHPHLGGVAKPHVMCGIQPLKSKFIQKRIIGGNQASFGEFPWQAHIRIAGFQCGGVLLSHQYVATAAHCVHRAKLSQIIIHLGEYDTKDLDKAEILPKQTLGVVERKIHPQFKYMLTQPDRYDVALLKLSRSVHFQDNILPICLPPQGKDYEGAMGVVAGWGKTDTSFGKTGTNLLQKVYVPIINNRICFGWHELKDIILELHDEMFCAGHEQGKMDACLGDSGGPLVVNDGGRWTLVGITSAGFGCAVDHQPGIYHKVSKTVPWILANIND